MEISVLKQDALCAISSKDGRIDKDLDKNYGIYYKDMRLVSRLDVSIDGHMQKLVSAQNDSYFKQSYYYEVSETVFMKKERIVGEAFAERYTLYNHQKEAVTLKIRMEAETDFLDMFEVRDGISGVTKLIGRLKDSSGFHYSYIGLDSETYTSHVNCSEQLTEGKFEVTMEGQATTSFELTVAAEETKRTFEGIQEQLEKKVRAFRQGSVQITTDNEKLNRIIQTSLNDLQVLSTNQDGYDYYCAGVPFFMALFGRDGLITGLFTSMVNTDTIKSMLHLYAKYQGTKVDDTMEEEPGKIIHELRISEMPKAGINEFARYYGTTDATLLYLMLVIKYYRQTGDKGTVIELKDSILAALNWLEAYGTGDNGYVQYSKKSQGGNTIHGWRDSPGGVRNSKGEFPAYPHSLCEFQSYAYYVYRHMSDVLEVLGRGAENDRLQDRAADLKKRFNRDFWMEDQKFFAQGLDGNNEHIDSITSDVGHLLFSDIIDEDKKGLVVDRLCSDSMYTGYGIRTFAKESITYNPTAYHGGSVWPHDTAFILMGMASEDEDRFMDITKGLLSTADSLAQMPELFCGFDKSETAEVVPFATACRPQAWSCATPYILMEKMLGIDFKDGEIRINPMNHDLFADCMVKDMPLGKGRISFRVHGREVKLVKNTSGFKVVK